MAKFTPTTCTNAKKGDFVRLRNGWTKMEVVNLQIRGNYLYILGRYSRSSEESDWYIEAHEDYYDVIRPMTDFVYWDSKDPKATHDHTPKQTQERENKMANNSTSKINTLYQTVEKTPRYGVLLAIDSQGKYVLDLRATGAKPAETKAFAEKDVERVVPYTFRATTLNGHHTCDYSCEKGDVAKGDFLISSSGNMYLVKEINTACEKPKKAFIGKKLATTSFGSK